MMLEILSEGGRTMFNFNSQVSMALRLKLDNGLEAGAVAGSIFYAAEAHRNF